MSVEKNIPEKEIPMGCPETPEGGAGLSLCPDETGDGEGEQFRIMTTELLKIMADQGARFTGTRFVVTNRPDGDDVTWQRIPGGYAVRLCAESGWHWCQAAYQLGYALTHCLIDHTAPDREAVSWAEELICEAAAIKLMSMLADRWRRTPFGREDPDYEEAVREYIAETLADRGTGELYRCGDREALQRLNDRDLFDDRLDESHGLVVRMGEGDLKKLAEVRRCAADGLLIHTHLWRRSSGGSLAVDFVCRLQERIPGCEIPAGVSVTVGLEDSKPSPEQIGAYGSLIRSLRDLPFEHVVFTFMDPEEEKSGQTGPVFFQACRYEGEDVIAEMRLAARSGAKMFRLRCHEDQAVKYLEDILTKGVVPDPDEWQDITRDVFPAKT